MSYDPPIIVRKIKKTSHGGHSGAWKIAYADFVTAMMAFFLLLWLISMTTDEQKKGIADYFSPPNVTATTSGAGGAAGGKGLDASEATMTGASGNAAAYSTQTIAKAGEKSAATSDQDQHSGATQKTPVSYKPEDDLSFHSAATSVRQAWQALPDITDVKDNLVVEETPQGLNIRIMDQEGRPMFPEGSKYPFEATRKAIAAIAPLLEKLSNQITISGHTAIGDSFDDPHYGAWELSSDRANAVREILSEFGLSDDHIASVVGRATADPLFPNDPFLPGNERVDITVLHEASPVPPDLAP